MDYKVTEEKLKYAYISPDINTSDEDLIKVANDWYKESGEYHDELKKIGDVNEKVYKGHQTKKDMIPSDMSDAVQNHIFMGIETVVPIITANAPQFIVEPPEESDLSIKYANSVQKVLGIIYEEEDVRTKGEMLVRHMLIYRFGAWKPFYNTQKECVDVKWIRPQRLYFPKVSYALPYMMEKVDITSDEFIAEYGEEKFKAFLKNRGVEADDVRKIQGLYTIWVITTPELEFVKSGSFIVDKKPNPTYNFKDKNKNFFKEAKIPYILASAFRLGNEPVGETDLIQQTIPIQDVINVVNRLIINNATKTGNAQWLIDSGVMTEEEARTKITNSPGLIVYGNDVANQNKVRRDAPPPLPNYIPELKIMAERAFDNIFGTHATTRGDQGGHAETLGGKLLMKQSDYGRIDLLVREYERCVAELGNWFVQLIKMHYNKKKVYRSYGESGTEFASIEDSMVEQGIKVLIKSGTTLPTDEMTKRREAIELWSMGALDAQTLYERLKFPNPAEAAKRLLAWKQGQLAMEAAAQGTGAQQRQNQSKPMPNPRGEIGKQQQKISGGK